MSTSMKAHMPTPSTRTSNAYYRRSRRAVLSASTVCHLCGLDGATTVDHLTPHSVGVALGWPPSVVDAPDNLAPAHPSCNYRRGARPLETYREDVA